MHCTLDKRQRDLYRQHSVHTCNIYLLLFMETKYLQRKLNILSLHGKTAKFIEISFQTLLNYERKLPTKTRSASGRNARACPFRMLCTFLWSFWPSNFQEFKANFNLIHNDQLTSVKKYFFSIKKKQQELQF